MASALQVRTEEELIKLFRELGALWKNRHVNPLYHALLTDKDDGKDHSEGYFNWGVVAQYSQYAREVARDLARKAIAETGLDDATAPRRVVGPGYGAITLADRLSESLGAVVGVNMLSGFTQKSDGGMVYRGSLEPMEKVLLCDGATSSGGSLLKSRRAVEEAGGSIMPFALTVFNRSGLTHIGTLRLISLVDMPMRCWTADECPLCKQGSKAIRPNEADNWRFFSQAS